MSGVEGSSQSLALVGSSFTQIIPAVYMNLNVEVRYLPGVDASHIRDLLFSCFDKILSGRNPSSSTTSLIISALMKWSRAGASYDLLKILHGEPSTTKGKGSFIWNLKVLGDSIQGSVITERVFNINYAQTGSFDKIYYYKITGDIKEFSMAPLSVSDALDNYGWVYCPPLVQLDLTQTEREFANTILQTREKRLDTVRDRLVGFFNRKSIKDQSKSKSSDSD